MLQGQQTLVFSEEWKAISTHHIMLGTDPIGGHRATVRASHLPAEPFSVEAAGGSAPTRNGPTLGSPLTITPHPKAPSFLGPVCNSFEFM